MPGDNIVISMLGDADGNGAGGFAVLDAQTFEVKGRWENGGADAAAQLRLLVPAAQERADLVASSASPTPTSRGFDLDDVAAGRYGHRIHFWDLAERRARADDRPRRAGADPARGALAARPRRRAGLRRRGALQRRCSSFHRANGSWAVPTR